MKYIPVATVAAEAMSRAIWNMQRPNDSTDTTVRFCDWIVSAKDPNVALLLFPDEFQIPVRLAKTIEKDGEKAAEVELLESVVAPFIELGNITREELDQLKISVSEKAGTQISVYDLVPDSWKTYIMDAKQAIALGFMVEADGVPSWLK